MLLLPLWQLANAFVQYRFCTILCGNFGITLSCGFWSQRFIASLQLINSERPIHRDHHCSCVCVRVFSLIYIRRVWENEIYGTNSVFLLCTNTCSHYKLFGSLSKECLHACICVWVFVSVCVNKCVSACVFDEREIEWCVCACTDLQICV